MIQESLSIVEREALLGHLICTSRAIEAVASRLQRQGEVDANSDEVAKALAGVKSSLEVLKSIYRLQDSAANTTSTAKLVSHWINEQQKKSEENNNETRPATASSYPADVEMSEQRAGENMSPFGYEHALPHRLGEDHIPAASSTERQRLALASATVPSPLFSEGKRTSEGGNLQ